MVSREGNRIVIRKDIRTTADSKAVIKELEDHIDNNYYSIDLYIENKYVNSTLLKYLQKINNEFTIVFNVRKEVAKLLNEFNNSHSIDKKFNYKVFGERNDK